MGTRPQLIPADMSAPLKPQVRAPYLVLVLALLAGDARAADALSASLAALGAPSVLATIEDYMWCKLTLMLANSQVCTALRRCAVSFRASALLGASSMVAEYVWQTSWLVLVVGASCAAADFP